MQLTKNKMAATAGLFCAGGLSLAMIGTGVGANFVQRVTGNAHISVGTLACQLANPSGNPSVTISGDKLTATVNLPEIESSAAGSSTAPVVVKNTGTMPLYVNWETATSGSIFDSGAFSAHPVANGVELTKGSSQSYDLGFDWTALNNPDMGTSGTVTYTANCTDTRSDLALYQQSGGTASWASDGSTILLGMPANPAGPAGAGIDVLGQSSTLPAMEPVFHTNNYAAGSPRWDIELSNGHSIIGYPSNANLSPGSWAVDNGNTYESWSAATSDPNVAGATVTGVAIRMDADQTNITDTISYIQYDGQVLLGS